MNKNEPTIQEQLSEINARLDKIEVCLGTIMTVDDITFAKRMARTKKHIAEIGKAVRS